jgi:integrase
MGPDTPSVAAHSALVRRHPIRFSGSRSPKLDNPVAEPLTDDELRAMLKACRGPDLRDKRDEALIRLMFTTGARAGEVVAMEIQRLGPAAVPPTVIIRRGKGGKGRVILLSRGCRLPSTTHVWVAGHWCQGVLALFPGGGGRQTPLIEVVIGGSGHLSRPGRLNPIHSRRLALIPAVLWTPRRGDSSLPRRPRRSGADGTRSAWAAR